MPRIRLTLGSLILIGGSLGDLYGERRIFALGVGGFGVASLLCALSPSIGALIVARALQGMAGALLTPSALAVIVATFSESERGPAIGSWTAWGGIATVLGPLAGGELRQISSWRCDLLDQPAIRRDLHDPDPGRYPARQASSTDGTQHRFPWRPLCALGLGGPVFALIEQPRLGWSSQGVIGPLIAGVALFGSFLVHESLTRIRCCRLGCFVGATSPRATSRRLRCTRACRSCSSS